MLVVGEKAKGGGRDLQSRHQIDSVRHHTRQTGGRWWRRGYLRRFAEKEDAFLFAMAIPTPRPLCRAVEGGGWFSPRSRLPRQLPVNDSGGGEGTGERGREWFKL